MLRSWLRVLEFLPLMEKLYKPNVSSLASCHMMFWCFRLGAHLRSGGGRLRLASVSVRWRVAVCSLLAHPTLWSASGRWVWFVHWSEKWSVRKMVSSQTHIPLFLRPAAHAVFPVETITNISLWLLHEEVNHSGEGGRGGGGNDWCQSSF